MDLNAEDFVSRPLKNVGTLGEFSKKVEKLGYKIMKNENDKSPITIGQKGRPQIILINEEGRQVMLRISIKLNNEFILGNGVDLNECIVYDLGIDGAPELVVGVRGTEVEIVTDWKSQLD
jgi:hypothetical protein